MEQTNVLVETDLVGAHHSVGDLSALLEGHRVAALPTSCLVLLKRKWS